MRVISQESFCEFGKVFVHPSASSNILSYSQVEAHSSVSANDKNDTFQLTNNDGSTYNFVNCQGRYVYDLDAYDNEP